MEIKKRPNNNILLLTLSLVMVLLTLEFVFFYTEKIDFYSGAMYTIDAENDYNNSHRQRVHISSDILGLSYELNPGISIFWQGTNITTNSLGLREREIPIKKPDNTFRVIALGDSVTFGAGIDVNKTFLKVLERNLNYNSTLKYEVINAGVSGYNLIQKYIFLENKLIKYEPDLVLINFVQDDYGGINVLKYSKNGSEGNQILKDNYELFSVNMPKIFPIPKKLNSFFLKHSAFYRFLNLRIYNILSKINPINYPPEIYKLIGGYDYMDYNKNAINKFYYLSQEKNIPIIIISFPNLVDDNTINDKWILTYPLNYNYTVIDLFPLFKDEKIDFESIRLSSNDYAHFNEKGHKIVGDILYKELIKSINLSSLK